MIAFACKQCGARFDRPDEAAGSLIFCACGAGTRVPFESTLPPSPTPALPPRVERPVGVPYDRPLPRWGEEPSAQPRGPRDRNYCFNHPSVRIEHTCADCGETFCGGCVVAFQEGTRCGPCKNFKIRATQRPASVSVMAILAPLLALGAGLLWLFVMLMVAGAQAGAAAIAGTAIIGLFPQLIAFTLAGLALMKVESENKVSGRDFAITGMVSAVACSTLILLLMFLVMQVAG